MLALYKLAYYVYSALYLGAHYAINIAPLK